MLCPTHPSSYLSAHNWPLGSEALGEGSHYGIYCSCPTGENGRGDRFSTHPRSPRRLNTPDRMSKRPAPPLPRWSSWNPEQGLAPPASVAHFHGVLSRLGLAALGGWVFPGLLPDQPPCAAASHILSKSSLSQISNGNVKMAPITLCLKKPMSAEQEGGFSLFKPYGCFEGTGMQGILTGQQSGSVGIPGPC